jgi:hypothetical protein
MEKRVKSERCGCEIAPFAETIRVAARMFVRSNEGAG